MPYGDWINDLPMGFFLVVHVAAFAIGAGFAWLALRRDLTLLQRPSSRPCAGPRSSRRVHEDSSPSPRGGGRGGVRRRR